MSVIVLKVKCPWKIGGRESGCEPYSQIPTYDTLAIAGKQATAGMLTTAGIPAATGTPALNGTPAGEGTISTEKTTGTAGSVWKSYKSGRK